jgi:hypothetical protein
LAESRGNAWDAGVVAETRTAHDLRHFRPIPHGRRRVHDRPVLTQPVPVVVEEDQRAGLDRHLMSKYGLR